MKERLAVLEKTATSARVTVYPTRVGGDHTDRASAARLVGLLNEAKLCQATIAKKGPVLEGEGWPNEAKVLWLYANAARDYARQHPVDSDYVLFADYWLNPRGEVWAVHFVVCDRAGEWVISDLQNNHQADFQRVNPKTLADCDRLVLERLKSYLTLGDPNPLGEVFFESHSGYGCSVESIDLDQAGQVSVVYKNRTTSASYDGAGMFDLRLKVERVSDGDYESYLSGPRMDFAKDEEKMWSAGLEGLVDGPGTYVITAESYVLGGQLTGSRSISLEYPTLSR
jgi:hypothetical protein